MGLIHLTSNTVLNLPVGKYRVVAIGPGGDGGTGGTAKDYNTSTAARIDGAFGAGAGAAGFVYVGTLESSGGTLIITIDRKTTSLAGALALSLPKAGSGTIVGGAAPAVTTPGNSVGDSVYTGTYGGGPGAPCGMRITAGDMPPAITIKGGIGDSGNGDDAISGEVSGVLRYAGVGAKGASYDLNREHVPGKGGKGAEENRFSLSPTSIFNVTVDDIVKKIEGGNGSKGTTPSPRPAVTGISGTQGGGGGGSWTSGTDGEAPTAPGRGVNGKGGKGGLGGIGCVWFIEE